VPTPAPPPKPAAALLPSPLTGKALAAALYGNGDAAAIPRWRPAKDFEQGPNFEEASACRCEVGEPMAFTENGAERAYALTSAGLEGHDCHSCAPIVGAVALTRTPAGWRVDARDLEVGTIGAYGLAPGGALVAAGSRHAVLMTPGYTNQGVTAQGLVLFMEAKEGGFAEVLSVGETDEENGGDCEEGSEEKPCWAWTSAWEFVPSGKEVPDFRLTTKGTRNLFDGEGVKPFAETRTYVFDGKVYAAKKG
jgi:hypothetical protein